MILLVSFVVGVTAHGWVQAVVARRLGDRRIGAEGRQKPDPRGHIDPFGAVGAGLAGLGWTRPVALPDRRRRGAVLAVALSGPLTNLVLGAALLVAWRYGYSHGLGAGGVAFATVLQQGVPLTLSELGSAALLLGGASQLYLGALSLVPLPPLDGGRLLFALAPRTLGWQKAEYHLVEQNIGIAIVLALLLLPLGGSLPLLPHLLDIVLAPLLRLLLGG
jgi:Zn-dependent protease